MGHAERGTVMVSKWRARWWWTSGQMGGAWQVARAVVVDKWPAVLFAELHKHIHAYIHTSMHTYAQTHMHAYKHTHIRTDMHTYMDACMHTRIFNQGRNRQSGG